MNQALFLLCAFGCALAAPAAEVASPALEDSPPAVGYVERERFQQIGRETQELYRKRVTIPDAGWLAPPAAAPAEVPDSPNEVSGGQPAGEGAQQILLAGMLLLPAAIVMLLGLAVHRGAARAESKADRRAPGAGGREQEEVFAKFVARFHVGPACAPQSPAPDAAPEHAGQAQATCARPPDDPVQFFAAAPEHMAALRTLLQEASRSPNTAARDKMLGDLRAHLRVLEESAGRSGVIPVPRLASALTGLLLQLAEEGSELTPSALRTLSGGVDLLEDLCLRGGSARRLAARSAGS